MSILEMTNEIRTAVDRWDGTFGAPAQENRKTEAVQVFTSSFIERAFATSHPVLPVVWFGPFIVYGLVVPFTNASVGLARGLGLYAAGVLVWTLVEYVLHRFVFHLKPSGDYGSKMRIFMMHGYHHQFPNDRMRLVAPPIMSWPVAVVFVLAYRALLGPNLWWTIFGGTCLGYLAYDWIHYYTHHFRPTTALGKFLRRNHMLHHFNNPEANHGISSPLWDFAFGTFQGQSSGREAREEREA
jgi:sterol desaturase/sphingolipid hydroxylase (fatty acid hydroxylase superfamily)